MTARREDTALGVARARFVDGLPRKASELKGAAALLAATPGLDRAREEMRRRLHALFASAQVFRIEPLADALRECIDMLDRARDERRPLAEDEIDRLVVVSTTLPSFAVGGNTHAPSVLPPRGATLAGVGGTSPDDEPDEEGPVFPRRNGAPAHGAEVTADPSIPVPVLERPAFARLKPEIPSESVHETATVVGDVASAAPTRVGVPVATPSAGPAARPATSNPAPLAALGRATPAGPSQPASSAPAWLKSSPGNVRATRAPQADSLTGAPIESVVSVLLVGPAAGRLAPVLPPERFEVATVDPTSALAKARSGAPDVILIGDDVLSGPNLELVSSFRSDPATDLVPILLVATRFGIDAVVARARGADDVLPRDLEPRALVEAIARHAGLADARPRGVGTITIRELADRMADEIRQGLVDAADHPADVPVPLGDGSEVLAAAWSAIARVRAVVSERSEGRVRFREADRRGGPALLAIGEHASDAEASDVSLEGRRAIVVDDDPAVVWFFAGVLREAGALVGEAHDGEAALAQARKLRPDVLLSDILMPRMDGLALCREMKRDPSLSDVPVILLSWKEDFLQRMRELRAGASGYLRKEEGAAQILERVRGVLRPCARFEARLREGGEVRGRVEGLGVLSILRSVATVRPYSRITVRDAYNLFEIEVRDGKLVALTRTASDGSFARGTRALPQLLGVTAGRFVVEDADGAVRATLDGLGAEALDQAAQRLGALVDAVSGKGLTRAEVIRFDDEVLPSLLAVSTEQVTGLVRRMEQGEGPRALVLSGEVAPELLESILVDLARRGAITSVHGADGEDRVAVALADRRGVVEDDEPADPELAWLHAAASGTPRTLAVSEPPIPGDDLLEEALERLSLPPPEASEGPSGSEPPLGALVAPLPPIPPTPTGARRLAAMLPDPTVDASDEEVVVGVPAPDAAPLPPLPPVPTPRERPRVPMPTPPRSSVPPARSSVPPVRSDETDRVDLPPREPAPGAARATAVIGWTIFFVALVGIGFFAMKSLNARRQPSRDAGMAAVATAPRDPERPIRRPIDPATRATAAPAEPPVEAPALYGAAAAAADVAAGQGRLVIEAPGAGPAPEVQIDGRVVGTAPVSAAVDPGRHEVQLRRDDEVVYRYLYVAAGSARTVSSP